MKNNRMKKAMACLLCIVVLMSSSCAMAGRVDAQEPLLLEDHAVPTTDEFDNTEEESEASPDDTAPVNEEEVVIEENTPPTEEEGSQDMDEPDASGEEEDTTNNASSDNQTGISGEETNDNQEQPDQNVSDDKIVTPDDEVTETPDNVQPPEDNTTSEDITKDENSENQNGENVNPGDAIVEDGSQNPSQDVEDDGTLDSKDETTDGDSVNPDDAINNNQPENPDQNITDDIQENPDAEIKDDVEQEIEAESFDKTYKDSQVVIHVTAEEGIIPTGAELSVVPVVQQPVEDLEDEEEITKAEELNEKYEEVQKELQASVAEDETKEIAGFLAYDISFLITDEDGNVEEIEPDGNVSVSIEFAEAYLPDEIADSEDIESNHIDVMHMKETEDADTGETVLKAEVLSEAQICTTENAEIETAEFVVDSFSIFTITWSKTVTSKKWDFQAVCVDEEGKVLEGIDWESKLNDITIVGNKGEEKDKNDPFTRSGVYLSPLAPYLRGYVLNKIVLGTPQTGEMSNIHVEYIRGEDTLERRNGSWKNGKWTSKTEYTKLEDGINKIYFVYQRISKPQLPEIPDEEQKREPEHKKYIRYNEKENDYTLTLDVTGMQEPETIDVLLIVDVSGSMNKDDHRYLTVNKALETLKESLLKIVTENEKLSINVGVVTFSSSGDNFASTNDWLYTNNDKEVDAQIVEDWTDIEDFQWSLTEEMIKGYTNWQAGIRTGEEMLQSSPAAHRKFVVFLTDGDPTRRYAAGSDTVSVGTGRATSNSNEGDPFNNCYDATINEWMQSPALQSAAQCFVINVLNPKGRCGDLANDIGATLLSGEQEADLKNSFKAIADGMEYSAYTDVVIKDTLSEYVQFVEEEPTFTVQYTEKDSTEAKPLVSDTGEKLYSITREGKTIQFSVLNGAELEDGVTYSISFRVKPTEKAVKEYIISGYPHIGEETTDAPGNHTSEGKGGFYSNDFGGANDGRAVVTYNYNKSGLKDATYFHPVVQVNKPADDKVHITKRMGTVDENGYPITLQIRSGEIKDYTLYGSNGDGFTVTDTMADYTNFLAFGETEINGHKLSLSEDKKMLTTILDGWTFIVAEFLEDTDTIIWYLNSEWATVEIDENGNGDCTYSLTYYVNFSDSGKTELLNTNQTTYVEIPKFGEESEVRYLYPDKMPYFVNVVGDKKESNTEGALSKAVFCIYRDEAKTQCIAENVISDENGHFAFQLGQSDLCSPEDLENGQMTVYLEEVAAPDGYVKDTVVHPITVQLSGVTYIGSDKSTENHIWDDNPNKDWGSVQPQSGKIVISHDSHETIKNDLLTVADGETLKLLYYNNKPWEIKKVSTSDASYSLKGAEFGLYAVTNGTVSLTPTYTGVSGEDGKITSWQHTESQKQIESVFLQPGTYKLQEIKAPQGYAISANVWTITIMNNSKAVIEGQTPLDGTYCYTFENAPMYELPSTGGVGIFVYIISGTFLMMASMLILYKKKYARRC